jgi:divalent metal cation (Fe/Co/Zn/Cd) transporter
VRQPAKARSCLAAERPASIPGVHGVASATGYLARGAASLLIGLLLIVVAYLLMRRNLALLIDEAAPADIRERLRQAVAQEPWVAEVAELTAVYIGPRQLLVLAHVVPVVGTELTANIGRLRRRLLAVPAIAAAEITPVQRTQ